MLGSENQATILNNRLQRLHVCVPKQRKLSVRVAQDQSARVKFTGKECIVLLESWDRIVDEIIAAAEDPHAWVSHASQT